MTEEIKVQKTLSTTKRRKLPAGMVSEAVSTTRTL